MRTIFILQVIVMIALSHCATAQQVTEERILQPAAMQEDFNYLRKATEDTHPGLYMHHTREAMQYKMDSLYQLLNEPMSFFDFYKVIAYLIAEIKCEHTYCNPYCSDFEKIAMGWNIAPVQPYFTHNKAYVTVNLTADTSIHSGYEIVSVNHRPIDSIKHEIYKYLPADGNMESSKEQAISSILFNVYYYLFVERPAAFDVEFKTPAGQIVQWHWNKPVILGESSKTALANPANKEIFALSDRLKKKAKNPWRLELLKDKNTAILSVKTFNGDREKLFKFYDKSFTALHKENIGNLIIDLGNNGGGEEEYAGELLSYLADTSIRFIKEEYLITDSDYYLKQSNLPKDALAHVSDYLEPKKDGKILAKEQTQYTRELKWFNPKPNRFKGTVYFYINGGTSSAASTCAAVAQSNKLGIFAGDETAGSFAGGGSTMGLDLVLPNSKITTHTSIVYQPFATSGRDKDRGVIPDYYYAPTFTGLFNEMFGAKDFILNLISQSGSSK